MQNSGSWLRREPEYPEKDTAKQQVTSNPLTSAYFLTSVKSSIFLYFLTNYRSNGETTPYLYFPSYLSIHLFPYHTLPTLFVWCCNLITVNKHTCILLKGFSFCNGGTRRAAVAWCGRSLRLGGSPWYKCQYPSWTQWPENCIWVNMEAGRFLNALQVTLQFIVRPQIPLFERNRDVNDLASGDMV